MSYEAGMFDGFNHAVAPAIQVLQDALARKSLVHVAVDWQRRYMKHDNPDDYVSINQVNAVFYRAARFTKIIHPAISTITVGYWAEDFPDFHLKNPKKYGPVFFKRRSSSFRAKGFGEYIEQSQYDTLIVSGLSGMDCQQATVLAALCQAYKVLVPVDIVIGPLKSGKCNFTWEPMQASKKLDNHVREHYFNHIDKWEHEDFSAADRNNLHAIKSYEIVQALNIP